MGLTPHGQGVNLRTVNFVLIGALLYLLCVLLIAREVQRAPVMPPDYDPDPSRS